MKIIYVDTPYQGSETPNPLIINGEIKQWTVETHMLKLGQTLREFLQERLDRVRLRPGGENVEGFYLYDVSPVGAIVGNPKEGAMFVRCAYIKK